VEFKQVEIYVQVLMWMYERACDGDCICVYIAVPYRIISVKENIYANLHRHCFAFPPIPLILLLRTTRVLLLQDQLSAIVAGAGERPK